MGSERSLSAEKRDTTAGGAGGQGRPWLTVGGVPGTLVACLRSSEAKPKAPECQAEDRKVD